MNDNRGDAPRIAFLGLGLMGAPMARRLLDAGCPLTVWNRTSAAAQPFAAAGAAIGSSAAEAVREADVVFTMLADPAAVAEVGAAMAPALRPGTIVVDTSSIGPDAARAAAERLPAGVAYVDAPVMGSVDKAAAGELLVLAGGDLEPVAELLAHFGTVRACGPVGSGAALKAVLINAVIGGVVLTAEALALGKSLGLPDDLVRDGLAASPLAASSSGCRPPPPTTPSPTPPRTSGWPRPPPICRWPVPCSTASSPTPTSPPRTSP